MPFPRLIPAALAASMTLWASPLLADEPLRVEINNIKSNKGTIYVMAFSTKADFETINEKALKGIAYTKASMAEKGKLTLLVKGAKPGCCALVAFHDENDNKDIDMIAGIPREGYAFSNGEKDGEPPAFDKAIVKENSTQIPLIYW
ncbi:DUF2141 domain-containing protein [Cohaesibacter gelatinilyticus]|uniref:Uncharacterized conserved protein, DUF2141 family n=1 Tax=Cohaesibacter gelatinilyticus TaxID=372072 RepID=A0A285PD40_9HYPH|nr:DUF2141 domain-containing protein [Cohaesibacter gelatinilyticus]SNZ19670.1 Uncharacterized conserved protein, DUF2141 family [Cohaesibacter gelatinilyticus]